jgi:hypothetical protein
MGRTSRIGRRPRSELSCAAAAVISGDIYDAGELGGRGCRHSWHRSPGLSHRRRSRRRTSLGTLLADFHGALDTDDGATILFSWHGYARPAAVDRREIVGSITHLTGTERYAWLNNTVCAMVGEVRPRKAGESFEVVFEVAELAWEPLG